MQLQMCLKTTVAKTQPRQRTTVASSSTRTFSATNSLRLVHRRQRSSNQLQRQRQASVITSAGYPTLQTDDPVITALFVVSILALSVVTVGVAYLSFMSWRDDQDEKAAQQKAAMKLKTPPSSPSAPASTGKKTESGKAKKPVSNKGFGK